MKGRPRASAMALAVVTPTMSPDQARAYRRGHAVDCLPAKASIGHGLGDGRIQHLDMGPGGDLRHHAAEARMQGKLGADHIGKDCSLAVRVPAHDSGGGFIAARLDAEDDENAGLRASRHPASLQARPGQLKGRAEQAINGAREWRILNTFGGAHVAPMKTREPRACQSARF